MKQNIRYIMVSKRRRSPDLGTYRSYDIVAVDLSSHAIVTGVRDVTSNKEFALHTTDTLNRCQVSPSHMADVIKDLLT